MPHKTLSTFLKEETAKSHQRLEQRMGSHALFTGAFHRDELKRMLLVNYQAHLHIEPALFACLQPLTDVLALRKRAKLPALRQDLRKCNVKPEEEKENEPTKLTIPSLPFALGMMYVLEGATLGGNVIRKQLHKIPEFKDHQFHYFGIYGEDISKMWSDFLKVLHSAVGQADFGQCLQGAEEAYRIFEQAAHKQQPAQAL